MKTEGRKAGQTPVNIFYSTPSCYVNAVHKSRQKWEVKSDDLQPYAISPGAYWTGYFTSRANLKGMIREAGQEFAQTGFVHSLEMLFGVFIIRMLTASFDVNLTPLIHDVAMRNAHDCDVNHFARRIVCSTALSNY